MNPCCFSLCPCRSENFTWEAGHDTETPAADQGKSQEGCDCTVSGHHWRGEFPKWCDRNVLHSSLSVSVCSSFSIFLPLSVPLSLSACICLFFRLSLCLCLFVPLSVSVPLFLSVCLSLSLSFSCHFLLVSGILKVGLADLNSEVNDMLHPAFGLRQWSKWHITVCCFGGEAVKWMACHCAVLMGWGSEVNDILFYPAYGLGWWSEGHVIVSCFQAEGVKWMTCDCVLFSGWGSEVITCYCVLFSGWGSEVITCYCVLFSGWGSEVITCYCVLFSGWGSEVITCYCVLFSRWGSEVITCYCVLLSGLGSEVKNMLKCAAFRLR